MATVRNLKIKTSTCKRIVKELHSYEKEVEREAAKTADMKDKGADHYDLKQQENVLAESRMMIPDCRKRLEASLADLKELWLSWRKQMRRKAQNSKMLTAP
ncbi:tubulin-folding cofactor A-like [Durio zibethinus]|uniref:Tubulin-specific chaperone A n=1 Tax=Durio zibethinus TaxID=66656 RepID=A0A6P5YZT8_DURZI|nr:tubulin-folding cofactor A-like [Durio zibethinus]